MSVYIGNFVFAVLHVFNRFPFKDLKTADLQH